jgi:hypothetical protein
MPKPITRRLTVSNRDWNALEVDHLQSAIRCVTGGSCKFRREWSETKGRTFITVRLPLGAAPKVRDMFTWSKTGRRALELFGLVMRSWRRPEFREPLAAAAG